MGVGIGLGLGLGLGWGLGWGLGLELGLGLGLGLGLWLGLGWGLGLGLGLAWAASSWRSSVPRPLWVTKASVSSSASRCGAHSRSSVATLLSCFLQILTKPV